MMAYPIAGDYDRVDSVLNIDKQAPGHQKQFCKNFLGHKRYFEAKTGLFEAVWGEDVMSHQGKGTWRR